MNTTIYKQHRGVAKASRNASDNLVFSTFYYKGAQIEGTCKDWTNYINSETRLPFDDVYFSTLQVLANGYDIASMQEFPTIAECTNPAILKQLMFSLNNGLSFNQICGALRFRVEVCPDIGTSFCVNCNNVCKVDRCNDAYNAKEIFVNPCLKCDSYKATSRVLSLHYEQEILYPVIRTPITGVVDKHSIDITVNVSIAGSVYCYAAVGGTYISSEYVVKKLGVQHTTFEGRLVHINLKNLHPDTEYDVYCYTEDFAAHTMQYAAVLATKQRFTTSCCAGVVFDKYHTQVRESSAASAPSVFKFRLDAGALTYAVVNITISANTSAVCPYNVGSTAVATAKPAGFAITNSTGANTFIVLGSPGCYVLTTTLHHSGATTTTTHALSVLAQSTPVAPPALLSAQITSSGLKMVITFDSSTDRAETAVAAYQSSFDCSLLLSFAYITGTSCMWTSTDQLVVTFGGTNNGAVGDGVIVNANTLRSVYCFGMPATSTNCTYADSSVFVLIAAPDYPVTPTVVVTTSQQIGNCDSITLDPTASAGKGGRDWSSVAWYAEYTAQASGSSDNYTALATEIATLLNANYPNTRFFAVIPNALLAVGTLRITLRLQNYMGVYSQASVSTDILASAAVPAVSISGPRMVVLFRAQPVSLTAVASLPSCAGVSSSVGLTYTWMMYSGTTYVTTIPSLAIDPRNFKLDGYSLTAQSVYTVQVVVTSSASTSQSSANVKLQIISGGVVARFAGGDVRRISTASPLVLDAAASYDVDDPTNSAALRYAWSCVEVTAANYGAACMVTLPSAAKITVSLSAYDSSLITRTLQFTLVATNAAGISANASATIEVYSQSQIPAVSMSAVRLKYNVQEKIILTGVITAASRATLTWSTLQFSTNYTSLFLTPVIQLVPVGRTLFQQAIAPNTLQAGVTYTMRLGVEYSVPGASLSYAEVIIVMNEPPSGGALVVEPTHGTELNTTFLLQTYDWTDDPSDYPITYSMHYYAVNGNANKLLKASNQLTYVRATIGRGIRSNDYNVTCVATATDYYGSLGTAHTSVTVLPSQLSIADVNTQLNARLSSAFVSKDPGQVAQVIVAVSGYINSANCSQTSAAHCESLHRKPCVNTAQTCGTCMSGYVGANGDFNFPCVSAGAKLAVLHARCDADAQCASGYCASRKCANALKPCPNDCSGYGTCVYTNYTNSVIATCSSNDPFCSATCACEGGRYGSDCALTAAEFEYHKNMRQSMCASLLRAAAAQDVSADVLLNRAELLSNLLIDPSQVSLPALYNCSSALTTTILEHADIAGLSDIAGSYISTISTVLGVNDLPSDIVSDLDLAYESMATGIQSTLAIGEDMTTYTTKNMRFGAVLLGTNNTDNAASALTVPQSDYEKLQKAKPTKLTLNISSGVVPEDGAVGVAVFQYNKTPFKQRSASASVGFQSKLYGEVNDKDTSRERRRGLATSGNGGGVTVAVDLQNINNIAYYATTPEVGIVDCLRTGVPHNVTLNCTSSTEYLFQCPGYYGLRYNYTCPMYTLTPFCTSYDGTEFSVDNNCHVATYDATSTVCECSNADASRRLATANSDLEQFASVATVVVTSFVQIITIMGDKAPPAVEYDSTVLILMSTLVATLAATLAFYLHHDKVHVRKLFAPPAGETVASVVAVEAHAHTHYSGKASTALELNYGFPLHDESTSHMQAGSVGGAYEDNSQRRLRHISIETFFNALLPKELTGLPWHRRLRDKLAEHDWYAIFQRNAFLSNRANGVGNGNGAANTDLHTYKRNDTYAHTETHHELKSLRWLLLAGRVLNFLFFTTVLVANFYSDDGTCEEQTLQSDCLSKHGLFGLGHTCNWEPTIDSACTFNKLSFDTPFSLLVVAVVVTIVSLPFDHMFYFVVVKLKLSTSDVAIAYLKAVNAKVHRQVEPLVLKNNDAHNTQVQLHNPAKKAKKTNHVQVHPVTTTKTAAFAVVSALHDHTHKHMVHAGTAAYARFHELSGVVERRPMYLRAARLVLLQNKTDKISARKETHSLLNDIHTGDVRLRIKPSRILTLHMLYMRVVRRIVYAAETCYSYARGRGALQTSPFRDNVDEDTIQYVTDEVRYGRAHAKVIKRTMGSLVSDVDKEAYLIQQFLVECLPPLQRRVAGLYLFRKVELSKIGLSNTTLYVMFTLLMLYLVFTVVYIFLVGATIGSRASMQWLIVIGICFAHDLIVLQPLKIWMKFVAVASIASGELRMFHAMLKERSRFILTRMNGVVRNYNQMLHHSNPACRAARTFPELAASRLLISLNDSDLPVHIWRDQRMTVSGGLHGILQAVLATLLLPLMVLPVVTHEFAIEVTITALLNVGLVGLALLAIVNILIPLAITAAIVVMIVLVSVLIWRSEARSRVTVTSFNDEMLSELDQPVDAGHAATANAANAELRARQALLEAEEFTVYKDHRNQVSVKNHLQQKNDYYTKLIQKYKVRREKEELGSIDASVEDKQLPLFDNVPGEIATPFKVKPYHGFSPLSSAPGSARGSAPTSARGSLRQEGKDETKDDFQSQKGDAELQAKPAPVFTKADRFVPRHVRRAEDLKKRQEAEQKDHAAAHTEFALEFTNPMDAEAEGDAGDGEEPFNLPSHWGKTTHIRKKPAPMPVYDVASVTALLLKHDINNTVTTRKPVARPPAHLIRVPKEIQRRKVAEKLNKLQKEQEDQQRREESFAITFGDSDEEDAGIISAPNTAIAGSAPKTAGFKGVEESKVAAASTVHAVAHLSRNLRSMRIAARRRKVEDEEQAEAQRMKEAEHFDINDILFDDDEDDVDPPAPSAKGAQAGVEEGKRGSSAKTAEAQHRLQQQPMRSGASTLTRRPLSAAPVAHALDLSAVRASSAAGASRAAAIDAAHRAQNISRLNRVIAMNNFVNNAKAAVENPLRPGTGSKASTAANPVVPAVQQTPHTTNVVPQRATAPATHSRRREVVAQRAEEERRRLEQERVDWVMMNDDDLFDQVISDNEDNDN